MVRPAERMEFAAVFLGLFAFHKPFKGFSGPIELGNSGKFTGKSRGKSQFIRRKLILVDKAAASVYSVRVKQSAGVAPP